MNWLKKVFKLWFALVCVAAVCAVAIWPGMCGVVRCAAVAGVFLALCVARSCVDEV